METLDRTPLCCFSLSLSLSLSLTHSQAFSRVVQKLIPQLPTLENLLNILISVCRSLGLLLPVVVYSAHLTLWLSLQNSGIEKAFLFDVVSKIYIATDR